MKLALPLVALAISLSSITAAAEFKLAGVFTDHAVLQRDAPVPVWGSAAPGDTLTVTFAGQTVSAEAGDDGRWRVTLDPLTASANPRSLSVRSKTENRTSEIRNLLVGEVWLCSGQSNMAMRVANARDAEKETASANHPRIRVFTVARNASPAPAADCGGQWEVCTPGTAGKFSATAFFFGRELHRELDVPVGLIVSAWSGSAIEAWTSRDVQETQPELEDLLDSWKKKDAAYTPGVAASEQAEYEKQFAAWKDASAKAIAAGQPRPKAPRRPVNPREHWHHPAVLFNGMIAPLVPYSIRGAIWYQGETNALTEASSALYELQLPLLINDWRDRWGPGDFPFGWVQLPLISAQKVHWARIRESMLKATSLPNTGMAVTFDIGEPRLLHPKNKQAFGHRLALWARAEVYGQDLPWSGPLPSGYRFDENKIVIDFQHAHRGLVAKDGPLRGFTVSGEDGEWRTAQATIAGDSVIASHPGVAKPAALRYAWANHPNGNLFNGAGLPATPFRAAAPPETNRSSKKAAQKAAPKKVTTPPPTKPPLEPADITALPGGTDRLDLFLLMGQSNMKGRGVMPEEPKRDPQIVMMHRRTDGWFLARHPLHLVGNPVDFKGADNAGVGSGLAFAETLAAKQPGVRIGLIPCAVGGTAIGKWKKGQRLYDDAIRRAKLALANGPAAKARIAGALWLQGESDSGTADRIANYPIALADLVDNLRADLNLPDLPFVACTIGELKADIESRKKINAILLDLPNRRPATACVDARDLGGHIGDSVHFDTPTQEEIGRRYAAKWLQLTGR